MTLRPDQAADPRKEQLLQSSPLLKAVLDTGKASENSFDISTHLDPYIRGIEGEQSLDWNQHVLNPLAIQLVHFEIFDHVVPHESQMNALNTTVLIGYELGNSRDINLFASDVISMLKREEILVPDILSTIEGRDKIARFVKGALEIGAYFKKLSNGQPDVDMPISSSQGPDSMRAFIEGLDLSGL